MEERAEITLAELAAVIHGGRVAADGGEGGGLGLLFDILKYFELVELLNKSLKLIILASFMPKLFMGTSYPFSHFKTCHRKMAKTSLMSIPLMEDTLLAFQNFSKEICPNFMYMYYVQTVVFVLRQKIINYTF